MREFFLLGKSLPHSFSPRYFAEKFRHEEILDSKYGIAELAEIELFPDWLQRQQNVSGLNVTIPYKRAVFPFLDWIDKEALTIGAVNTIAVRAKTIQNKSLYPTFELHGYNTDAPAFSAEVRPLLKPWMDTALILGNGASAATVRYVLQKIGLNCITVSRNNNQNCMHWKDLNTALIKHTKLIVNTTPIGQFANSDVIPDLPFEALDSEHLVFDLVYNPPKTALLQRAEERGCMIQNGLGMLHLQAEKSWQIWNGHF